MTRARPDVPSPWDVADEAFGEMRPSTERENGLVRSLLERTSRPVGIDVSGPGYWTGTGSDTIDTYCPYCDVPVTAALVSHDTELRVVGEVVEYTETLAVCPICGEAIGDSRVEGENLDRAYGVFEERYGRRPGE